MYDEASTMSPSLFSLLNLEKHIALVKKIKK
jgi:hypothetical protein